MGPNTNKIILLDEHERNTVVWRKVKKFLLFDLLRMRERNDAKLSLEDTMVLRGSIKEVKDILEAMEGGIFWENFPSFEGEENKIDLPEM